MKREPEVDPVILALIERGKCYVAALRKSADDRLRVTAVIGPPPRA